MLRPYSSLLCLLVLTHNAEAAWSTTHTQTIGPDARTHSQNLQCKTIGTLAAMMEAASQEGVQQFGTAVGQASYYVGFSTTPTNAANQV